LIGAVELGMSHKDALIFVSLGNCLAVGVNFTLGYFLYQLMHTKIENSKVGQKAYAYAHKYGYFSLILSPLPLIGDPITVVAGLIRLNTFYFILITFSLRIFRYWIILFMLK